MSAINFGLKQKYCNLNWTCALSNNLGYILFYKIDSCSYPSFSIFHLFQTKNFVFHLSSCIRQKRLKRNIVLNIEIVLDFKYINIFIIHTLFFIIEKKDGIKVKVKKKESSKKNKHYFLKTR